MPVEDGATEPELGPVEAVLTEAAAPDAESALPVTRAAALEQAGGLISATFETLVVEVEAAPSQTEIAAVAAAKSEDGEAPGVSAPGAASATALAKRSVTSVPVGSDGLPDWSVARRVAPEARSAAAVAARDVASAVEPEIEPLAFASAPEDAAPHPAERPGSESTLEVAATPAAPAAEPEPEPEAPALATADSLEVEKAVNVRSGPSGGHQRLFVLAAGTTVRATHAKDGWVRIVDGKDREGWVYSDYLESFDIASLPAPAAAEAEVAVAAATEAPAAVANVRAVKGQGVNVRSGPSTSSGKLFALRGGTKVTVSGEQRGWLKVTDPDGRTGWAYETYLTGG